MQATLTITKEIEVEIKTLHVSAKVRYWEDATVNGVEDTNGGLIPFRNGDNWEPVIDIDAGKVIDWPAGVTADIHYKVCDCGTYTFKDEKGEPVLTHDGYVPDIMEQGDNGYGDYIIMKIDGTGQIQCWKPTIEDLLDKQ
jgi:hypothetical protein